MPNDPSNPDNGAQTPQEAPMQPRKARTPSTSRKRAQIGAQTPARKSKAKARPRRIGAPAREEAYQMIAQGIPLRAVARELRIAHETVMVWRDSPEGQKRLEELRRKRDVELGAVLNKARQRLEELIPRAIERLSDALESPNPQVALRAAREILDRGGLPRTEIHENRAEALDLSVLAEEDLDTLRRIHETAARRQTTAPVEN